MIAKSDDSVWNSSLPIGNEAYKLIKLTKSFELTVYDFQRFQKLRAIYETDRNSYEIIEMKFSHIGLYKYKNNN